MRFTDNSELTTANMAGADILAGTDVSSGDDKKFTLSGLAAWYVETYNGSTLAGTSQSLQTAINNAIPKPTSPSNGQFLMWNGSAWVASSLPTYNGGVS